MPVIPNIMERTILFSLNKGPGPMLDLLEALAFKTVATAVRLGIFNELSSGSLPSGEIARRINADENGTVLLLQALESIGYLEKQGNNYRNSRMTAKWMVQSSPQDISFFFHHAEDLVEHWKYLDEAVRSGKTPATTDDSFDKKANDQYNVAMMATAHMAAEEIKSKIKLSSTARRLLDVGGGHGLHSINFCHHYPGLSATIFDKEQTRNLAEKNIASEGMTGRVIFRNGDFWEDDPGSGYDVALMFNIIHMYQPERNIELLRKTASTLNTGAMLVIMDQMAVKSSGPIARATAGLTGLNLFVAADGRTYHPQEVTAWLTETGFMSVRKVPLTRSPGFVLIYGRKAG